MADLKISQLNSIVTVVPSTDVLPVVQGGTTLKITPNQILGSGGTATLASATITGDLTVDTSTLKVDSTNNRVGVGTATPAYLLDIADASAATRFVATNTNNSAYGAGIYLKTMNGASMVSNATLATSNDGTFNLFTGTSADSTKLSINTSGDVNIALGNVVMATSGKGIDFSATAGTGTSELLADYEEGTFTPTIGASSGTATTVTINSAIYTKIGRAVTVIFDFSIVAVGTATGAFQFSLPFNQSASSVSCGAFRENGTTGNIGQVFYNTAADVSCFLYNNATVWNNGYRLRGTYTYSV